MKTLIIALADSDYRRAKEKADLLRIDISAFCTSLLTETLQKKPLQKTTVNEREMNTEPPTEPFDVKSQFRGYPERSILFAEKFIAEVLKVDPRVIIRKSNDERGIEIRDNFTWVEALLIRKEGIRVSFYGSPKQFAKAPEVLVPGRGNSYSRAVIETERDLEGILPLIRQARHLKPIR